MRRLLVHVGGHKTGSTYLQQTLLRTWKSLRSDAGLYVPQTATIDRTHPHQNCAWELSGDRRFRSSRGTLVDLARELDEVHDEIILLSSEDFNFSLRKPDTIDFFTEIGRRIGSTVEFVAVVREQSSLINSMYGQRAKMLMERRSFEGYLGTQSAYAGLDYDYHYGLITSTPGVVLHAFGYDTIERANPLSFVLRKLGVDDSNVDYRMPPSNASNRSPSPTEVAAARLLVSLLSVDNFYATDQTKNLRDRFEQQVLNAVTASDRPTFWGWVPSRQDKVTSAYESSNRRFSDNHLERPWSERVAHRACNEQDLSDPAVRAEALGIIGDLATSAEGFRMDKARG